MNNPRRQPGESDYPSFAALKELNIIVKEKTFHPVLFHTQEEVFYTRPQMKSFDDDPVDSLYIQLTYRDLYMNM
jgi:hypothetical protein